MDKYHIYEEIGKGEFSQVFKGREKKKIEYVAIKRVEKGMMSKVVNEVQVMHKLESPHILKFHDWYETRNNLWLILEYCTGADLECLLKQDGHLPETSVRMFGLDMVAALKYMHGLGIIHGDLRPKNFLVDEYGILKICDFKFARKVPKTPLGDTAMEFRGLPAYMSPELFTSSGMHSFGSDFWSLGCVLYELRRGVPPFGWELFPTSSSSSSASMALRELIHRINTAEPITTPVNFAEVANNKDNGSASNSTRDRSFSNKNTPGKGKNTQYSIPSVTTDLADLLLWLLEKNPVDRCEWRGLTGHPFWGSNADADDAPTNLPPQPAFEAYIRSVLVERAKEIETNAMDEYGLIYNLELEEYVYENDPNEVHPLDLSGGGGPVALPPPPMSITQHHHKSNKPELPQSPSSHHTLYHAEGKLTSSDYNSRISSPSSAKHHQHHRDSKGGELYRTIESTKDTPSSSSSSKHLRSIDHRDSHHPPTIAEEKTSHMSTSSSSRHGSSINPSANTPHSANVNQGDGVLATPSRISAHTTLSHDGHNELSSHHRSRIPTATSSTTPAQSSSSSNRGSSTNNSNAPHNNRSTTTTTTMTTTPVPSTRTHQTRMHAHAHGQGQGKGQGQDTEETPIARHGSSSIPPNSSNNSGPHNQRGTTQTPSSPGPIATRHATLAPSPQSLLFSPTLESTAGTTDMPGQGLGSETKGSRIRGEPISKTTPGMGVLITKMSSTNHMDKDGLDVSHMDDQLGLGLRPGGSGYGGGGGSDRRLVEADWSKGLQLSLPSMLLHSSDTQVKPIVGNKAIEIIERASFKSPALPFPVINGLDDIGKLSQSELEAHLTLIYKALHRHIVLSSPPTATAAASPATMTALNDRLNVLGYLSTIVHSAEVANIVLNTHFLSLLLRLLRGPTTGGSNTVSNLSTTSSGSTVPYNSNNIVSTASSSSTHNNNQHASATAYWNTLTSCRTLAATILACSLRYTTFVQPPTAKTKEDHIIPTLINILNPAYSTSTGSSSGAGAGASSTAPSSSALKTDVRLRRRSVAALGEIIFYITAQDDDTLFGTGTLGGTGGLGATGGSNKGKSVVVDNDKWVLPPGAVTTLMKCLREDPDEIVRHYAAKTFENVMAQGGMEYKRRLTSLETAKRLLEITQMTSSSSSSNNNNHHGTRNEALQSTCGMALAHMIHWVVTADPSMQIHPAACMMQPGAGGMTHLLSPTRSPPGTGVHDSNHHNSSSSSQGLAYGQQPVTRRTLSAHGTSPLSRLNATRGTNAHSPSKGNTSGQGQGLGSGQYNSIGVSSPTNNHNQRPTLPMGTDDGLSDPSSQGGIPGVWAYFIARIFEHQDSLSHPHQDSSISNGQNPSNQGIKGGVKPLPPGNNATNVEGVAYMLDTLREGPPKLQQAYLNIINMIFAGEILSSISSSSSIPGSPIPSSRPIHDPHDPTTSTPTPRIGESSPRIVAADQVLHTLREHILRTPSILPSLVRLIDQGGSSAVRGKAMITAQLLCRKSPSLLAIFLGERRLPPALVRVIEPYISRADINHQLIGGSGTGSPSKPSNRVISVLPSSGGAGGGGGGVEGVVIVEPSYVEKAALSMVLFLREACVAGATAVYHQLVLISQINNSVGTGGEVGYIGAPDSPNRRNGQGLGQGNNHAWGGHITSTPSSVLQASPGLGQGASLGSGSGLTPGQGLDPGRMEIASEVLRIAISTASQPTLRRLMVSTPLGEHNAGGNSSGSAPVGGNNGSGKGSGGGSDSDVVLLKALAGVLQMLPVARRAVTDRPNAVVLLEAIMAAEQATMTALETIAQIDVDMDARRRRREDHHHHPHNQSNNEQQQLRLSHNSYSPFLDVLTREVIPHASAFAVHPESDARVVVAASLRRLIPAVLRTLSHSPHDAALVIPCLDVLLTHIPYMLADHAPIPQYALRLLCEALNANHPRATQFIIEKLIDCGGLEVLLSALGGGSTANGGNDDHDGDHHHRTSSLAAMVDDDTGIDPQLPILLRTLFEKGQEQETLIRGTGTGLGVGTNSLTNLHLRHNANHHLATKQPTVSIAEAMVSQKLARVLCRAVYGACWPLQLELVVPLIDLLHRVLHYVILCLAGHHQDHPSPHHNHHQNNQHDMHPGENLRLLVSPLRHVCPALLVILSGAGATTPQPSSGSSGMTASMMMVDPQTVRQLHDTSARCLGILFDIFPEMVASQLLASNIGEAIATHHHNGNRHHYHQDDDASGITGFAVDSTAPQQAIDLSPRGIISSILINPLAELKLRVRLLKIVSGVGKIAPALGSLEIAARVKDMLLSPPLHRALMGCINTTQTPTPTSTTSGGSSASGQGLGSTHNEENTTHARIQKQDMADAALCVSLARELLAGAIQMP